MNHRFPWPSIQRPLESQKKIEELWRRAALNLCCKRDSSVLNGRKRRYHYRGNLIKDGEAGIKYRRWNMSLVRNLGGLCVLTMRRYTRSKGLPLLKVFTLIAYLLNSCSLQCNFIWNNSTCNCATRPAHKKYRYTGVFASNNANNGELRMNIWHVYQLGTLRRLNHRWLEVHTVASQSPKESPSRIFSLVVQGCAVHNGGSSKPTWQSQWPWSVPGWWSEFAYCCKTLLGFVLLVNF